MQIAGAITAEELYTLIPILLAHMLIQTIESMAVKRGNLFFNVHVRDLYF